MTEPQDFESLDDLFRKTFDRLPENASPSGWDRPSERVWQHIQTTVQPPEKGWSAKAITLVSALAVTIVVGLYLFVNQPVAPVTKKPVAPEQQVAAPAPAVEQPTREEVVVAPTTPPATPTARPRRTPAVPQIRPAAPEVVAPAPETAVTPPRPAGSRLLPGSGNESVSPNTTVDKQRLEELRMKPVKPLPVLPEKIDRQIVD